MIQGVTGTTGPLGQAATPASETPTPAVGAATTPEAMTPTAKVDDSELEWVRRHNQLAKRERQLTVEQKKAREAMAKVAEYEAARSGAKQDPMRFLELGGLTYEELTQHILNDGKATPEQRVAALEAAMNDEKTARQREKDEFVKREEEQKVHQFKQDLKGLFAASEDYELCHDAGDDAADLVYDVMLSYFQENNEMMTPEVAIREVERHLEQRLERMVKLKKVTKYFPQPNLEPGVKAQEGETPAAAIGMTLTHNTTHQSPVVMSPGGWIADEAESKRAAAKLIEDYWAKHGK